MTKQDCYENGCDLEKQNLKPIGFEGHGIYGYSQYFECRICGHGWIKRTDMCKRITWLHGSGSMTDAIQNLLGV